jgi:hypothetical protein
LSFFDQVESKDGREVVPRNVTPVVPPPRRKWLNVVFDLNGVLCQSALASYGEKFKPYRVEEKVLCHRNPTLVGPKAVFARQNLAEFLREVSDIADRVIVWTTMVKRNAEGIAEHLFSGCRPPYDILSQDQCTKIEMAPGRFFHKGPHVLCLKDLSEALFKNPSGSTSFSADNTILIDDSPIKSVCNENGNAIFLGTWTHGKRRDNVLVGELLPWLQRLHSDCPPGQLREYVVENRIGFDPLDANDYDLKEIVEGMKMSSKVMGCRYELPGIDLVIEPPRRRK